MCVVRQLCNNQGLGFTVLDGTVLDKRRLRVVFSSVMGLFATVVPIVLSLSPSASGKIIYGQLPGSTKVFAFNSQMRTYEDGVAFCHSLWMTPASIHSDEEFNAMLRLLELDGSRPQDVYLGAEFFIDGAHTPDGKPWSQAKQISVWGADGSAPDTIPGPEITGTWRWLDGTDFDYLYTDLNDPDNYVRSDEEVARGDKNGHEFVNEKLYGYGEGALKERLIVTKIGSAGMSWNSRSNARQMVCSAQSLAMWQRSTLNLAPIPDATMLLESNATTCCTLIDSVWTAGGR